MFTNTQSTKGLITLAVTATIMFAGFTAMANAATYAYVDVNGDVKSVTAADWKTAIAVAPNIHKNSGVLLLTTAADYEVVGDSVLGY